MFQKSPSCTSRTWRHWWVTEQLIGEGEAVILRLPEHARNPEAHLWVQGVAVGDVTLRTKSGGSVPRNRALVSCSDVGSLEASGSDGTASAAMGSVAKVLVRVCSSCSLSADPAPPLHWISRRVGRTAAAVPLRHRLPLHRFSGRIAGGRLGQHLPLQIAISRRCRRWTGLRQGLPADRLSLGSDGNAQQRSSSQQTSEAIAVPIAL